MSQYKGHDSEFCEKIFLEYEQMFTPSDLINKYTGNARLSVKSLQCDFGDEIKDSHSACSLVLMRPSQSMPSVHSVDWCYTLVWAFLSKPQRLVSYLIKFS